VMASYGESKNKATASGDKYKDRILSVGYDYALSKRTGVYGVFMNNDATDKDSGQTFAVGIKHSF
jgi:predicted porin